MKGATLDVVGPGAPSLTILEKEPSLLAYGLQQVGVPLGALVVLFVVPEFSWSFVRSGVFGQSAEVIRCVTVESLTGILFGFMVRRIMPAVRTTGRWIWVIPVSLIVLGFLQDSLTFSFNEAMRELFFPGPNGEEGWGFLLLTCPTIATVWYSAVLNHRGAVLKSTPRSSAR